MYQAIAMDQQGLTADLLQLLPPVLIGRNTDGRVFVRHLPTVQRPKGEFLGARV